MPLRPEERSRYPKNWPEIRARIRARAGDKCEGCGVPNHTRIVRTTEGWRLAKSGIIIEKDIVVYIVCTTAHLNHTPEDCRDENLRFWCQKCHNGYDARHRAAGIKERAAAGTMRLLFEEGRDGSDA